MKGLICRCLVQASLLGCLISESCDQSDIFFRNQKMMWFVTVFGPPGASAPEHSPRGMGSRLHSAPNLSDLHSCRQKITKQHSDPLVAHFVHTPVSQPLQIHGLQHCRQLRSSPKLSEFMQRSPLPTIMGSPTKVNQGVCFWVSHSLRCVIWG